MLECLDCGNTSDFRELFHDWSLITRGDDGSYGISESLSFGEAEDPAHPIECHDCDSTNITITQENK